MGASRLLKILGAVGKKGQCGEMYQKYVVDVALVSASLTRLSKASRMAGAQAGQLN